MKQNKLLTLLVLSFVSWDALSCDARMNNEAFMACIQRESQYTQMQQMQQQMLQMQIQNQQRFIQQQQQAYPANNCYVFTYGVNPLCQ